MKIKMINKIIKIVKSALLNPPKTAKRVEKPPKSALPVTPQHTMIKKDVISAENKPGHSNIKDVQPLSIKK